MTITSLVSHPALDRSELALIRTQADDPAAVPLIAGLLGEMTARTGYAAVDEFGPQRRKEFATWLGGDLILLDEDDVTVGGGAYRRYDSTTAQLDWLWIRPDRRRLGLARRVVAELERSAARSGYERVYAVAGPGQTEVRALFASSGFTPLLPGTDAAPEYLGFVKPLGF